MLVKSHTCPELASFPSELVYEAPTAVKIVDTEIGRDTETFFNPAPAKAFPPCLHANANMVIIITRLATFYGSTCKTHNQIAIPEVGITGLWCELSKCH